MELPEGEQELLSLTEDEGEDGLVYLLLQRPHGLNQAASVWHKTVDNHL